jgi:2-oxoglutarate ferredoxin oxidoreductase subunit alpha
VKAYESVLVPEVNLGQLRKMVRSDFLVDAQGLNKVNGLPFRRVDIELAIISQLDALHHGTDHRQNKGHSEEQK